MYLHYWHEQVRVLRQEDERILETSLGENETEISNQALVLLVIMREPCKRFKGLY